MPDLADYLWMARQWHRFRRLLIGALAAVWVLCSGGLVWLRPEDDPAGWYFARLALMFMLGAASLVTLWLWLRATVEIRGLKQKAAEVRLQQARSARERKSGRRHG